MAPRSSFAFAVINALGSFTAPTIKTYSKPARKPLIGKGSKWHRRMVESGRKTA
jgi:hypothetical protein